jgi:hypothetical protein
MHDAQRSVQRALHPEEESVNALGKAIQLNAPPAFWSSRRRTRP